ncbi:MAG: AAA family ATPase [Acidimicrobiales bacterium]
MTAGREHDACFGRVHEQTQFSARLAAAVDGHGSFVLLEGEAGIGKTTLVAALCREAAQREFEVGVGAAVPFPDGRPLRALVEALGVDLPGSHDGFGPEAVRLRDAVAALLHGVASAPGAPTDPLYPLHDALLALLEELAAHRPQLLVLEDLHWADASTLGALWALLRRLPKLPVLLVATCRPWPSPPELLSVRSRLDQAAHAVFRWACSTSRRPNAPCVTASVCQAWPAGCAAGWEGAAGNLGSVLTTVLGASRNRGRSPGRAERRFVPRRSAGAHVNDALLERLVALPQHDVEPAEPPGAARPGAPRWPSSRRSPAVQAEDVVASVGTGAAARPAGRHRRRGHVLSRAGFASLVIARLEPSLRTHLHHEIGSAPAERGRPCPGGGAAPGRGRGAGRRAGGPVAASGRAGSTPASSPASAVDALERGGAGRGHRRGRAPGQAGPCCRRRSRAGGRTGRPARFAAPPGQPVAAGRVDAGSWVRPGPTWATPAARFTHMEKAALVEGLSPEQRARCTPIWRPTTPSSAPSPALEAAKAARPAEPTPA